MTSQFLPITKAEAAARGWDQLDFVYIIGDAYVDHPSFGAAIISRVIESLGFSIGIISQPVSDRDYMEFGAPKYAFLVTGGNIDSMVAHYTAAKRKRSDDAYTPGGKAGRPSRPRHHRLFPQAAAAVSGLCHRHRRAGGLAAALCPLRLLGRRGAPLHPCRRAGRPAAVRHG